MPAAPPAVCPACLADHRADAGPCPACGKSLEGVTWTQFPGGIRVWIVRGLLAAIPGGVSVYMLVGAAHLWLAPWDPSMPVALWAAFAIGATAIGLALAAMTNLIFLARRWDYRSADHRVEGWVQTLHGRVFEARGTAYHASPAPVPPTGWLTSSVLADPRCSAPLGLAVTVLGMAGRGAVALHLVERREIGRPPGWPLCFGWLWARTVPESTLVETTIDVAAAPGEQEVRPLERALLACLPPVETVEAPSPGFRAAAAIVRQGRPVPLRIFLDGAIAGEGGPAAVRVLGAHGEAAPELSFPGPAELALAAGRGEAPELFEVLHREAALAVASDEAETDAGR